GFAMNLGPTELLIVFAIVMLLFGATKLPKLARSLGESAKEFKSAQTAIDSVNEPVTEPHDTKVNEPHDTRS
ncbi:MAG: twin-arginine translocase TatA/TatE family subunit, partial [Acidimicrobiia bacterium]